MYFDIISKPTSFSHLCKAYNCIIASDALPYRELTQSEFSNIFDNDFTLTLEARGDEGELLGFLFATLPRENNVAYLSFFGVLPTYRNNGIGSSLLDTAAQILRQKYHADRIDIVFRNPAHLPWIIPGSSDGHPCAPGILTSSDAQKLLLSKGYVEWCAQISYYIELKDYVTPSDNNTRKNALEQLGIQICYYDQDRHRGLPELFDAIKNPSWKKEVLSHLDRPIAVAVDTLANNLTVGYTGPFSGVREGAGMRGNFCGIGTHPDYRAKGIGTLLFCFMCEHHRQNGATFMSLYTGETNPARYVYEAAGAKAVARWSNMRLELT